MPAAAGVDLCPGGKGTEGGAAVELVALHAQPWVVATPLLAHELQQLVGQVVKRVPADGKRQRSCLAQPQHVAARSGDRREVELGLMVELSPPFTGQAERSCPRRPTRRYRLSITANPVGQRQIRERNGDFRVLVRIRPGWRRKTSARSGEPGKANRDQCQADGRLVATIGLTDHRGFSSVPATHPRGRTGSPCRRDRPATRRNGSETCPCASGRRRCATTAGTRSSPCGSCRSRRTMLSKITRDETKFGSRRPPYSRRSSACPE